MPARRQLSVPNLFRRSSVRFSVVALLAATITISAPIAPLVVAQSDGVAPEVLVDRLAALLDRREGELYWNTVSRIAAIGPGAVPRLRALLADPDDTSEKKRLGCAKVILEVGEIEDFDVALLALEGLVRSAKDPSVRLAALETYGAEGEPETVDPVLSQIFESESDPAIVIPLARTLWGIDQDRAALERLVSLLGSTDEAVRVESALTLAEIGYFEGGVRDVLRRLEREPTTRGRRAKLATRLVELSRRLERRIEQGDAVLPGTDPVVLLKLREKRIEELERALERGRADVGVEGSRPAAASARGTERVLDEVMEIIEKHYVDPEKAGRDGLYLRAVAGMVQGLDPFSSFLDVEESTEFTRNLDGNYPGIGAHIRKKDGEPLEILRPVYGGPAYRSGIQSGDRVIAIDGIDTAPLDMEKLSPLLKGPEGSKVHLEIERRGVTEHMEFDVIREQIELPSVYYEALPLGIGYIRLTQFGVHSADEFEKALAILETKGLSGLIFDLRDNGGGRLEVAVRLVDLFVRGDMPIVSQRGRDGEEETGSFHPDDEARLGFPIVVLINENSASASEIVSGALQDFGRATLIGKRTYGKGSVQNLIPLESRPGSQLKLTVRYYFLPLGRSIHTIRDADGRVVKPGGVEPDVSVDATTIPSWRIDERFALRDRQEVLDYVDRHFTVLQGIVPLRGGDPRATYPEIEQLHASLGTRGELGDVCAAVRYHVLRRLEDQRGRQFAFDAAEDLQLQRALLEVLRLAGRQATESDELRWLEVESPAPADTGKGGPAPK
jgi:carboxyl-terminal processing protease